MKSLSVLVTLALLAGSGRALYGGGMLMGGYGMPGLMGKMGMMGGHGHDSHSEDDNLLLNCAATFTNDDGTVNNELAVTIESVPSRSHSGMGTVGMLGLGYASPYYGYGYGGYGYGGYGFGGKKQSKDQLKATIEIFTRSTGGKGFVVFTERANPSGGCTADNFGAVLTESMGGHTSMGGLSTGLGLYTGYGYGYPYMGTLGYGLGLGHGMGSLYGHGHHGHDDKEGAGIAAEISIQPGILTTASVDNLEFNDLADLAGRGVVVCSEVTYDWQWQPTCVEPYFSCCALKYDNAVSALSVRSG